MDRPSPRDAPVTSATLPSSEKSFVTFDLRFAPVYSSGFRVRLIPDRSEQRLPVAHGLYASSHVQ
jgi:hypothetical protein